MRPARGDWKGDVLRWCPHAVNVHAYRGGFGWLAVGVIVSTERGGLGGGGHGGCGVGPADRSYIMCGMVGDDATASTAHAPVR